MNSFFDNKLLEKPIVWGSFKKNFVGIENNQMTLVQVKPEKEVFCSALRDLLNNQEFANSLSTLKTRQLRLLNTNLVNLSEAMAYPPGLMKYLVWSPNYNEDLIKLVQLVKGTLCERVGELPNLSQMRLPLSLPRRLKPIYARCEEIFQAMRNDYVICFHAQSTRFTPYNDLLKELEILENPNKEMQCIKVLRSPTWPPAYKTVQEYFADPGTDLTPEKQNSVLSVDLCSMNTDRAESAFHFLAQNTSNLNPEHVLNEPIAKLLQFYNLSDNRSEAIKDRIKHLQDRIESFSYGIGNMLLICLPKDTAYAEDGPLWVSAEFGFPYLSKGKSKGEIINLLQEGKIQEARDNLLNRRLRDLPCYGSIQGRVMAAQLSDENGVKIFRINAIPRWVKKECRQEVIEIAQELYNSRHCRSWTSTGLNDL